MRCPVSRAQRQLDIVEHLVQLVHEVYVVVEIASALRHAGVRSQRAGQGLCQASRLIVEPVIEALDGALISDLIGLKGPLIRQALLHQLIKAGLR